MGFDGIFVRSADLESTAATMRSIVGKIDQEFQDLESALQPLKRDWVGQAPEAYEAAKKAWNDMLLEMNQLLDAAQRDVMTSSAEYQAADRRGAASFDI